MNNLLLAMVAFFGISYPIFRGQCPPNFFLYLMFFSLICIYLFAMMESERIIESMGDDFNLDNYAGKVADLLLAVVALYACRIVSYRYSCELSTVFYIMMLEAVAIFLASVMVGGFRLLEKHYGNQN